jgi:hypothetical protein
VGWGGGVGVLGGASVVGGGVRKNGWGWGWSRGGGGGGGGVVGGGWGGAGGVRKNQDGGVFVRMIPTSNFCFFA